MVPFLSCSTRVWHLFFIEDPDGFASAVPLSTSNERRRVMTDNPEASGLAASPQPLAGLVDYQDGSIVSRTLIKKDAGTVTAFAFDRDEALSEHAAPFDALVFLVDGEASIEIEGTPHHLKHGEMILLPANRPHAVRATTRFKMILTMIKA
jgi:quercetin dioxygenase-like cupin family protein